MLDLAWVDTDLGTVGKYKNKLLYFTYVHKKICMIIILRKMVFFKIFPYQTCGPLNVDDGHRADGTFVLRFVGQL